MAPGGSDRRRHDDGRERDRWVPGLRGGDEAIGEQRHLGARHHRSRSERCRAIDHPPHKRCHKAAGHGGAGSEDGGSPPPKKTPDTVTRKVTALSPDGEGCPRT